MKKPTKPKKPLNKEPAKKSEHVLFIFIDDNDYEDNIYLMPQIYQENSNLKLYNKEYISFKDILKIKNELLEKYGVEDFDIRLSIDDDFEFSPEIEYLYITYLRDKNDEEYNKELEKYNSVKELYNQQMEEYFKKLDLYYNYLREKELEEYKIS